MTIDEVIKHYGKVAEEQEEQAWEAQLQEEYITCKDCAKEYRQLAEWLKELKQLRKQTKTGHWIDNFNGTISCSCCHTWFHNDDRFSYIHYCPNCGARMDEDERTLKYADQDTLKYADQDTMMPAT